MFALACVSCDHYDKTKSTCRLDVPTSGYTFKHLFYSFLSLYFKLYFAFETDQKSGGASQAAGASVPIFLGGALR